MKKARADIALLAVLAVLLHAGLLVWHNAVSLGARLQHQALSIALLEICHGGSTSAGSSGQTSELPFVPPPPDDQGGCPICKGMVCAMAILGDTSLHLARPLPAVVQMAIIGETIRLRLARLRPPTRAPPASLTA